MRLRIAFAVTFAIIPARVYAVPSIAAGTVTGHPGELVTFSVTLKNVQDAPGPIVESDNGITFDSLNTPIATNLVGSPACVLNPNIQAAPTIPGGICGLGSCFSFGPGNCQGAGCYTLSARIRTIDGNPLPCCAPTLYTCDVRRPPDAVPGTYPLISTDPVLILSPATWYAWSDVENGKIVVLAGTLTPTPTLPVPTSTLMPTSTAIPTPTVTPIPSATATPTSSPTPGPPGCGNGVIDAGEDCDNGGTCIGGANAGTTCRGKSDCIGDGVCIGGPRAEHVCSSNAECSDGTCQHCVTFGGAGCAANCTTERTLTVQLDDLSSGETIHSEGFPDVLLPFTGSEAWNVGGERARHIPFVVKADSESINKVDLSGFGFSTCACVRAVAVKTCGGTVFEADGAFSTDCTPLFTPGDSECGGKKPCAFVHGPGNSASGTVGCEDIQGANASCTQDSRGGSCSPSGPLCAAMPQIGLTGSGGPGSAVLFRTKSTTFALGSCADQSNAQFCPDLGAYGLPLTLPAVTGSATGEMFNVNGKSGTDLGPFSLAGSQIPCDALAAGDLSGSRIVAVFTNSTGAGIGDVVVTNQYAIRSSQAEPSSTATLTPTPTGTATPTQPFTPRSTNTPGSGDCCQCSGLPLVCGAPASGSCGSCMPVYGAGCDGASGSCALFTPTAIPTQTSTPGANDCCECDSAFLACGPASAGTCGECRIVFHASCSGGLGRCATFTPTPNQPAAPTSTAVPSSATPSDSPTVTPANTATPSPTHTPTPALTATPSAAPATATQTPTDTATSTLTVTATSTHTTSPTPSSIPTPTPSPSPIVTATVPPTLTVTATARTSPTSTSIPIACVGDCDGLNGVTVNEIITLVNVALGNAEPSACPHGVPDATEVNVALIIQAVNNALGGCV